jgi:hypothetical protein
MYKERNGQSSRFHQWRAICPRLGQIGWRVRWKESCPLAYMASQCHRKKTKIPFHSRRADLSPTIQVSFLFPKHPKLVPSSQLVISTVPWCSPKYLAHFSTASLLQRQLSRALTRIFTGVATSLDCLTGFHLMTFYCDWPLGPLL